jgi:hypothetical protein
MLKRSPSSFVVMTPFSFGLRTSKVSANMRTAFCGVSVLGVNGVIGAADFGCGEPW